jgi:predicted metalloprotease with PDZ domain
MHNMNAAGIPIKYQLDLSNVKTGWANINMTAEVPGSDPVDVALPFMSPGSAINSRNHPNHLTHLDVRDSQGQALPFSKIPEGGWRIDRSNGAAGPLQIRYRIDSDSFGSSHAQFNDEHCYVNGASAFMYLLGHDKDTPSTVTLTGFEQAHPDWQSVSALRRVTSYPHTFYAVNFQELADSTIEASKFEEAHTRVGNTTLSVVKHGQSPWQRLAVNEVSAEQNVQDFSRIYRTFIHEFGDFPPERYSDAAPTPAGVDSGDRYQIIKHYVWQDNVGSSGLEHYHGHELTFGKGNEEGIHRLYSDSARILENKVMSHELGHKLLAKFVQHAGIDAADFQKEHPSDGLWLTEGITEWLGTWMEMRSGLITPDQYVSRIQGQITAAEQSRAYDPVNARDDSLEAQHGRSDYYTKGALLGALLDLELLDISGGRTNFADVLRALKAEYGGTGRFHSYDDVKRIAASTVADVPGGKQRVESFFHDYLEDHKPFDYQKYLGHAGFDLVPRTDDWTPNCLPLGDNVLTVDSQGRPTVQSSDVGACQPTGDDPRSQAIKANPFRVAVAGAGLTLARTGDGKLQVAGVVPGGPAEAAGLAPFTGVNIEKLDMPGTPAPHMSFTFKKHDLFSPDEHMVTIDVPVTPQPKLEIVPAAASSASQLAVRQAWLQPLPASVVAPA